MSLRVLRKSGGGCGGGQQESNFHVVVETVSLLVSAAVVAASLMMMTPVDSWISGRYSLCWYIVRMGITSVAASTDCRRAFLNECLVTIVIHLQSFVFALQTSLLSASSVYSCPFCNLCFFIFESLCKLCFELCKAFLLDSCKSLYFEALQSVCVCVCVCVWIVNSCWRDHHRHGVYSHDRFAASNRLPLSSR